jgi:hypothetical protein
MSQRKRDRVLGISLRGLGYHRRPDVPRPDPQPLRIQVGKHTYIYIQTLR